MKCSKCHTENASGAKFCKSCGEKLIAAMVPDAAAQAGKETCLACGHQTAPAMCCARCGTTLGGRMESPLPRPEVPAPNTAVQRRDTSVSVDAADIPVAPTSSPNKIQSEVFAKPGRSNVLIAVVAGLFVVAAGAGGYLAHRSIAEKEAEAQRRAQEAAEAQRRAQEAEAALRRAQEAEAKRRVQEAAEAERRAQAEAQRRAQEAEAQRRAQMEAQRRAQEEADAQRRAQAEALRRSQQEAAARQAVRPPSSQPSPGPAVQASSGGAVGIPADPCNGMSGLRLEQCRTCRGHDNVIKRVFCEETTRFRYCNGKWGQSPECSSQQPAQNNF